MVNITLHGDLGKTFGEVWELDIQSVSEAINAIEILSNNKLYTYLQQQDKINSPYRVLINGDDFVSEEKLDNINNPNAVLKSNLILKSKNIKTIDIIPVIEGADEIINIVLGALLIIAGIIVAFIPGLGFLGAGLIVVGLGLLITGVVGLLASPPKPEDFVDPAGKGGYLFNGPENVAKEGGPVPVGYGRLLLGSQVIAATYNIYDVSSVDQVISTNITTQNAAIGGVGQTPTTMIQT